MYVSPYYSNSGLIVLRFWKISFRLFYYDGLMVHCKCLRLLPCPSAGTKYFLSGTNSDLSKTNQFCPWQNIFCLGQKFCPWLQTSFLKAKMIFKPWIKFLSWTKHIVSWTKLFCLGQIWFCPRQKTFCPGRWTGHKTLF